MIILVSLLMSCLSFLRFNKLIKVLQIEIHHGLVQEYVNKCSLGSDTFAEEVHHLSWPFWLCQHVGVDGFKKTVYRDFKTPFLGSNECLLAFKSAQLGLLFFCLDYWQVVILFLKRETLRTLAFFSAHSPNQPLESSCSLSSDFFILL